MIITRGNSYSKLHQAPAEFLASVARHLAIKLELGSKKKPIVKGVRFGSIFWHEAMPYGSMLHGSVVPAGLTYHVEALARMYRVPCEVRDVRVVPPANHSWRSVVSSWRPYQDEVHDRLCRATTGIVDAPPRSGKTLMAVRIVDELAQPVLYVAPSVAIVRQTYETFQRFYPNDMLARLDGEAQSYERDASKQIVIATVASVLKQDPDWFKTRKALIIDEFHHSAAESYHRLSALASEAYFRFMFTGTHFRTGTDTLAMEAVCAQVIQKIQLADLVPDYLVQPRVYFIPTRAMRVRGRNWKEAYTAGVVKCDRRNGHIVTFALSLARSGIPTIVLVKHRAHADALGQMIPDSVVVKGGEDALTSEAVREFLAGAFRVLVGTTVLGEGVDLPNAGALIYASAGSDGVTMMQSYFRPLTAHPGKQIGRIYDFRDTHHKLLARHSNERIVFARKHLGDCVVVP